MKKYDWDNAFPKPTERFHDKLCQTLDGLEKERRTMKKVSVKRGIIIAAAVSVFVIGSAVTIATQGTARLIYGNSTSYPNYKEIPTAEKLEKDIGIAPKIVSEFSNGYEFNGAVKVNNSIEDLVDGTERKVVIGDDGKEARFKSLSIRYKNGDDDITLSANPAEYDAEAEAEEAENYNGVSIRYNAFTNKFVPGDYQQTEQDIKDEQNGKYVFSYGTDEIEIHQVQGVTWVENGIKYHINAMDSPLGETELVNMAKEVIDF